STRSPGLERRVVYRTADGEYSDHDHACAHAIIVSRSTRVRLLEYEQVMVDDVRGPTIPQPREAIATALPVTQMHDNRLGPGGRLVTGKPVNLDTMRLELLATQRKAGVIGDRRPATLVRGIGQIG